MSAQFYETQSEEAFVLSSLKEFVKLWGSGCQASLQLHCFNGQASVNFSSQLGSPADRHFLPPHRNQAHLPSRQKSKHQRERDRARAAAHRAAQQVHADKQADTASSDPAVFQPEQQEDETPAAAAGAKLSPASAGVSSPSTLAASAETLIPPMEADPADPLIPLNQAATAAPEPLQKQAVPAAPLHSQPSDLATFQEVQDEFVPELKEAIIFATGVFENCPDDDLSEEYFVSLQKFILSEKHLEENISSVKIAKLSTRQLLARQFLHTVKVELSVKTSRLWEPPLAYIKRHLATNDWLKGNKTRITVTDICE